MTMLVTRYSKLFSQSVACPSSLINCSKANIDISQNALRVLYYRFLKRKFYSSPHLMVRRMRRSSSFHKEEPEIENVEVAQTKQLLDDARLFANDPEIQPHDQWTSDLNNRKHQREEKRDAKSLMSKNSEYGTIILFPGQGTQFVGMGNKLLDYPNVRKMYEEASEILGYNILKLSCEGPLEDLNQTKYQQPAIFLASLAAVEKLRHDNPRALDTCVATAGFSIGEITALTFAGAINFWNAVQLVKVRAEAMQIASQMTRGGMMTVFYPPHSRLGFACQVAMEYCQKIGIEDADCRIASALFPGCKVIAGNNEALEFIVKNKADFKLKKLRRLNVSGAFHTSHMKPAGLVVKEALDNIHITQPDIPVYSNLDGERFKDARSVRYKLVRQMFNSVRWESIIHRLYDKRVPTTYECGPGKTLAAILKEVNRKAGERCSSIDV